MAEGAFVFGVLDERAVVVDLVGVELEVFVDLADGAGRAGGGEDDLDATLADFAHRVDGLDAQAFVAGQQRPVEVQRHQVDAAGAFAAFAAAACFGPRRTALAFPHGPQAVGGVVGGQVVEVDAMRGDGTAFLLRDRAIDGPALGGDEA